MGEFNVCNKNDADVTKKRRHYQKKMISLLRLNFDCCMVSPWQGMKRAHLMMPVEATSSDMSASAREESYRRQGWWPEIPLIDRYRDVVEAHPNDIALVDDRGRAFTHSELWKAAETMAGDFRDRGVGARDIVLIVLPNWAEWHIAHLAVRQMGAIAANIPVRTTAAMMAHAVDLVSARCLVGTESFGGFDCGDILRTVASQSDHRIDMMFIGEVRQAWQTNRKSAPGSTTTDPELDHIMFTSSTTGMPKAVMHSANSLASFNITVADRFDLSASTPIFMASPLGHSVGAIHGSLLAMRLGAPLVLQQKWDVQQALAMIEEHKCDFTAAATPFLKDLIVADWSGGSPKLASMRSFLCGGAQVPPALLKQAEQEFPNTFVTVLWGMTEGGATTCIPGVCPTEKRLQTAGRPLAGLEMKVVDEDGAELPSSSEGELLVRGPSMFYGYFGQLELNDSLIGDDGFFDTGDRAMIDKDGYLTIVGRAKDLIIRGGVNISPVPIEDALAAHPDVNTVTVVGLPDARLGERICAVLGPGKRHLDKEDMVEFARQFGLAKQYWPEAVYHIDPMPMTPAGKIRKNDVRQWLAEQVAAGEIQS